MIESIGFVTTLQIPPRYNKVYLRSVIFSIGRQDLVLIEIFDWDFLLGPIFGYIGVTAFFLYLKSVCFLKIAVVHRYNIQRIKYARRLSAGGLRTSMIESRVKY